MGALIILALNGGLLYFHVTHARWGWALFQFLVLAFCIWGIVAEIRDNIKNGP